MRRKLLLLFGLAVFSVGCGGQEYAEVEGLVTSGNQPLNNVEVIFMPDPELDTFGPSSRAFTDEEGYYHLRSVRGQDGAVIGQHRVCIRDLPPVAARTAPTKADARREKKVDMKPQGSRVPSKYSHPVNTPFRPIEIKPGKQTLDFEIKQGA